MKFATKIWHFYKSVFSTLVPMSLKTILYSHCDSKRSGADQHRSADMKTIL